MGSKRDYLENKLLDHIIGNVTYTAPTALFSALFTAIPSDSSDGTEVTAAYTRITTTFGSAAATVTGQIVNTAAVTFSTAATAYTVVGWGLMDDVATGNMIYWATVTTLAVGVGDQATFAVGNIVITED